MKDISITENHPVKKRIILGPLGRLVLKLINWDIVGDLPDNKKIIIASAPHSSSFDSIYAFFVCLASDLKFYFLGSISMFTRIVVPIPFKKNPDKLGIPHPFGLIQKKIMINFGEEKREEVGNIASNKDQQSLIPNTYQSNFPHCFPYLTLVGFDM